MDVKGKSVLITSCDSGFGLLLAKSLAKKGMYVFAGVLDINSDGAEELKSSPTVIFIEMNVTKNEDVEEGFKIVKNQLIERNLILWAVVNNAEKGYCKMLEFTPLDKVRQLLEVNALGMLRICQKFSCLLRRSSGRIVNVTSIAGNIVGPFIGAYCSSKFSAEAISRVLRIELYPHSIPVITIQPNAYNIPIMLDSCDDFFGTDEINTYGEDFIRNGEEYINKEVNNSNENLKDVVNSLESAILNKNFQYNYTPNFWFRLKRLVRIGGHHMDLSFPVKFKLN